MSPEQQREYAMTQFAPFQRRGDVEDRLDIIGIRWTNDIDAPTGKYRDSAVRPLGRRLIEAYVGTVGFAIRGPDIAAFYFDEDDRLAEVVLSTTTKVPGVSMYRLVP